LAYAELLYAVAMVFRRFELEIYETEYEDIAVKHDYFIAMPKVGARGLRAKVVGVR
jgi:hypothetical protein